MAERFYATRDEAVEDIALGQVFAQAVCLQPGRRHSQRTVRKLIEGAGGKVISFYFTTGEADLLLISEADEAEAIIAALWQRRGQARFPISARQ